MQYFKSAFRALRKNKKVGRVIGVVKDFNYKSLYDKIEPAVLQIYPFAAWKVAVKLKTAGTPGLCIPGAADDRGIPAGGSGRHFDRHPCRQLAGHQGIHRKSNPKFEN